MLPVRTTSGSPGHRFGCGGASHVKADPNLAAPAHQLAERPKGLSADWADNEATEAKIPTP